MQWVPWAPLVALAAARHKHQRARVDCERCLPDGFPKLRRRVVVIVFVAVHEPPRRGPTNPQFGPINPQIGPATPARTRLPAAQ